MHNFPTKDDHRSRNKRLKPDVDIMHAHPAFFVTSAEILSVFKLLLFLFIGSEEFWRRTMYDKSKRLTASHCNGSNSQQHNIKHKAPLQTAKEPAHFSFLCVYCLCVKSSCTLLWIRGGNVEMWRHWEGFLITPASLILYMINNTQRFCHQAEQPATPTGVDVLQSGYL